MKIIIKPREFKCQSFWYSKRESVILVEKQEDIEPLWRLLCEQDDYWEPYKNLIKVAPKEIDSVDDISRMCEYCGKTDIDDVEALKSHISFIIYQQPLEVCY